MSALPLALLGRRSAKGVTILGLGFAATLATLAFGGAILLDGEAARIDRLARGLTVALGDGDAGAQAARARALAAMLARRDDLEQVARVAAPADGGDRPALFDAILRPGRDDRALRLALAGQPGIAVVRVNAGLAPLAATLRALAAIAALLLAAVLAAVVPLAAAGVRAMLADGAADLALLRRLGASDRQIAALVRGRVVREALIAGVGGAGAGGPVVLLIAMQLRNADDRGMMVAAIDPWTWTMLLAIPPALVGLACVGAVLAVRGRRR